MNYKIIRLSTLIKQDNDLFEVIRTLPVSMFF